jgi:hypothetical protein
MKRTRLLVLLGIVAIALPLGLLHGVAGAAGGSSTTATDVSIRQYADFNLNGLQLDVGLNVRCTGGLGLAKVSVTQTTPDSPHPVTGGGTKDVVCDGQTHSVGVSVIGVLYDAGKAYATADVTSDSGGTAHAERWITVQVV